MPMWTDYLPSHLHQRIWSRECKEGGPLAEGALQTRHVATCSPSIWKDFGGLVTIRNVIRDRASSSCAEPVQSG